MLDHASTRRMGLAAALTLAWLAVLAPTAARPQTRDLEAQRASPGYVDHRSPDAQEPRWVAPPASSEADPGGFDWSDAAVGAAAALGVILIALSVMFTVLHRRGRAAAP